MHGLGDRRRRRDLGTDPGLGRQPGGRRRRSRGVARSASTSTTTLLGGGFGRRFAQDFVIAAVQVSKAVGAPVKVVYTREDDMRGLFYRPASIARIRGGVDAAGSPRSSTRGWPARRSCRPPAWGRRPDSTRRRWKAWTGGRTPRRTSTSSGRSTSPASASGSGARSATRRMCSLPRASSTNSRTQRSRIPSTYRRALLAEHPRHSRCWNSRPPRPAGARRLPKGRARGIAVCESFGSYVAEVVEVSLRPDGMPRVHRVVCAVDCGMMVNPGIVRRQVQSAVIYGLSAALHGEITIEGGRVAAEELRRLPGRAHRRGADDRGAPRPSTDKRPASANQVRRRSRRRSPMRSLRSPASACAACRSSPGTSRRSDPASPDTPPRAWPQPEPAWQRAST